MKKLSFCCLLLICVCIACKNKEVAPAAPALSPLTIATTALQNKICVEKDRCASMDLTYPVLKGGDSLVVRVINDSIQQFVRATTQMFREQVKNEPIDSTMKAFGRAFEEFCKEMPDMSSGWDISVNGKVAYKNAQYLTIELAESSFLGGAHPNHSMYASTFDLTNAHELKITDFVKDTNALKPLLVKGYLAAMEAPNGKLADFVYEEYKSQLPLPSVVSLEETGILFFYNSYEVAPYAVGPADVHLTWEALGTLADKSKWIK